MKFSLYSLDRRVAVNWDVEEVYFPGPKGETGILADHTPMVSMVTAGVLRCIRSIDRHVLHFAVSHGFIRVEENTVVACVYTIEQPTEIDLQRAEAAQKRAQDRMSGEISSDAELRKWQLKLERAMIRQQVARLTSVK